MLLFVTVVFDAFVYKSVMYDTAVASFWRLAVQSTDILRDSLDILPSSSLLSSHTYTVYICLVCSRYRFFNIVTFEPDVVPFKDPCFNTLPLFTTAYLIAGLLLKLVPIVLTVNSILPYIS